MGAEPPAVPWWGKGKLLLRVQALVGLGFQGLGSPKSGLSLSSRL